MQSETEALKAARERMEKPERAVWIQGRRAKSWAFCCSECGEVSYYPQNPRKQDTGKAVMGYRYCPYCRAEMAGVAILRVETDAPTEPVRTRTVSPGSVDAAAILDGMNVERFAERLRKTLEERNMTQRDAARKSGINEVRMSRYVWGEKRPQYVHLYNLAAALGVDITWLSGREDTGPD